MSARLCSNPLEELTALLQPPSWIMGKVGKKKEGQEGDERGRGRKGNGEERAEGSGREGREEGEYPPNENPSYGPGSECPLSVFIRTPSTSFNK